MSNTMKEVTVFGEPFHTEIKEVPIPSPSADEVLVKVIYTDSNPKDWKYPILTSTPMNPGDDIAGYIHKVGSNVTEFKPGDRVAAFHVMLSPHGSYAEYAIAPAATTFHIPPKTSFEEAATIPLAAMTAALALYQQFRLPLPWLPAPEGQRNPLIIYGGSSAVGAFALKFAKLSNIHPVIAVAGSGIDYVKSLGAADHIVDYRKGNVVADLKAALGDEKCYLAFDAVSEGGSFVNLSEVLQNPGGKIALVLPRNEDYPEIPKGIEQMKTWVGSVHKGKFPGDVGEGMGDLDFGWVFYRYLGRMLATGKFSGHPVTVVKGGLEGIEKGLIDLKDGKASATKYVYQVAEDKY
ncbi:chaperonin 10-like protein [Morchella snyderi]|nr:chaperonin 10-like protein [Morchella snyderi]